MTRRHACLPERRVDPQPMTAITVRFDHSLHFIIAYSYYRRDLAARWELFARCLRQAHDQFAIHYLGYRIEINKRGCGRHTIIIA